LDRLGRRHGLAGTPNHLRTGRRTNQSRVADWTALAQSAHRDVGRRFSALVDDRPKSLLSVVAACEGFIAFMLHLLKGGMPGRQFTLYGLEGLSDGPCLGFRSIGCLNVRHTLMAELGLKVPDCSLRFLEQLLSALANGDLFSECLPCCFEHIGTGTVIVSSPDDRDRDLAITNEATLRPVCPGR